MLGIKSEYLTGKQTPCPACGGKDRFRFDDKDGRGTYYCNNCGAGDGVQLVQICHGLTFREAALKVREVVGEATEDKPKPTQSEAQRRDGLRAVWKASKPITPEDDAGRYLASRRIKQPFPSSLRFIPKLKVANEDVKVLAGMIALVRDPKGDPLTLHRTYLQNGEKAKISSPRKMMAGETPHGSYIELYPAGEVLAVAEGIETAMHVYQRFGVPCWSLISEGGIRAFTPPAIVKRLIICGDNDANFVGQAAAYALAHKIATRFDHIEAEVRIPEITGSDWADP